MRKILTVDENPLGYEKIGKLILRFSLPSISSNMLNAVYNIVDQIFIGHGIGYDGIAATTIAFPLVTFVGAVSFMLGVGCAAGFNLRLGAGEREKASEMAGTGLSMIIVCGVVLTTVFLLFLTPLLNLFGATEEIIEMATEYTFIVVLGVPFQVFTIGVCSIIRADGSPNWSMVSMMSGAVFNLIFDPVFMFAFGWGIKGIAWATTIGQVLSAILAFGYLVRGTKTVELSRRTLNLGYQNVKKICTLGLAAFTNQTAMTLVTIVLNNTLRHYGDLSHYGSTVTLGAMGAISRINMIFVLCTVGFGQGCQPIFSFNYGAQSYSRVKETLRKAIIINLMIGLLFFSIFQLFPNTIISIFGEGSDDYYEFATRYLKIFMFMTFTNGLQPMAACYFTATGRAKLGIIISLTRQIIFLIPLLLILPTFLGIDGVVFAGPVADTVAATLSVIMFSREIKKLNSAIRLPEQLLRKS